MEINEILNDKFIDKYLDKNNIGRNHKKKLKEIKKKHEKMLMEAKIFEMD